MNGIIFAHVPLLFLIAFSTGLFPWAPALQDAISPTVIDVTVDPTVADGTTQLELGVTHMQYSLDSWGDAPSVARGKSLLATSVRYQNQHIYGFGATNPNPSPGSYDWSSLDRRVALIRSVGSTPVITLCCAPDWMTSLGSSTSTYPNIPPTAGHYADFADLARRIAQRYPDVKYYQVWNEMKGFWDRSANNWDYVAYTNLYNQVYDALKGVDPSIKVGGPYLVIEGTGSNRGDFSTAPPITDRNLAVIDYWLAHKHGADFICVDRGLTDAHDPNSYSEAELFALTSTFASVAQQLRARTSLPIWWAEDYIVPNANWNFQAASLASMLYYHLKGGAAVSLRWSPQGQPSMPFGGNDQALFSDTLKPQGGQPFPAFDVYRAVNSGFPRGTRLVRASASSPTLEVIASQTKTLLINTQARPVLVDLNEELVVRLGPYQVALLDTPGGPVIAGQ